MIVMSIVERKKQLGAYYTDRAIADFLVNWAIRNKGDHVLDPSFGDGIFLKAACERLFELGGNPNQIFGVEIDEAVHRNVTSQFNQIPKANLINADFFDVSASTPILPASPNFPTFDAIIGNPPFIRYQRFKGKTRRKALDRARVLGVNLNGLCSSWAPFIVHAISFLHMNGRLAMVIPSEIMHALYARPVLEFIVDSFQKVTLITFRKRIFPDLSQDALLLLCDGFGLSHQSLNLVDLDSLYSLKLPFGSATEISTAKVLSGEARILEYMLPKKIRNLYGSLKSYDQIIRFGEVARISIGYVTGNNGFFHLSKDEVLKWNIPSEFLTPCVKNGSQLTGLAFTKEDWSSLIEEGAPNYLLDLSHSVSDLPNSVLKYLKYGEKLGVHNSYKCRVRSPWYVVPHIYYGDAFLTYMSGKRTRLVVNAANASAPNTLLIVRLKTNISMKELAISWLSSLTALSTEIEGHSLGGGMLKLEPGEAQGTFLAVPNLDKKVIDSLFEEVDGLLREDMIGEAIELVDQTILAEQIGLTSMEIQSLRRGADLLRERRYSR